MKDKTTILGAAGVVLFGALLAVPGVIATNPYDIEYAGGAPLGSDNVTIDASLVDGLTPIMNISNNVTLTPSESTKIETGYLRATYNNDQCSQVKYVRVSNNSPVVDNDDVIFSLSQGQGENASKVTVDFKNVTLDGDSTGTYAVGMVGGVLYSGYQIYSDTNCMAAVNGISQLAETTAAGNATKIFTDINIKVEKTAAPGQTIDHLYFGLTDIDRAQSYKILNEGNELIKARMFARSAAGLQGQTGSPRNMYVSEGKYIYSEFSNMSSLDLSNTSNVYTPINAQTQTDGLNIVLGFAVPAYNGIEYYTSNEVDPARITYTSDAHGTITGKTEENIEIDGRPTGSSSTPSENYTFSHWVANKDVTLSNGRIIRAGDPITSQQVTQIVVREALTLTAIHEEVPPVEEEYTVLYRSDANGRISGRGTEILHAGDNPSGSTSTPNEGYTFSHWVANKDVTLSNGRIIRAGDPITSQQVTQIVVSEDVTLSAIHEEMDPIEVTYTILYRSDAHGTITGIATEYIVPNASPTGTTTTPNENYAFSHWIANYDVTLINGTAIEAGNPITPAQLTQIVVTRNLTFSAIHIEEATPIPHETAIATYESDENGEITGITEEELETYTTLSGTTTKPKEGYVFSHWVADKDVTLADNTSIEKGEPISEEQLLLVVLTEDLTLTAIHEEDAPAIPNTGIFTGKKGSTAVTASLFGISLVTLIGSLLPRFIHKKLGFDK